MGNIKIVLDKDKNVIAEITPRFLSTENNGYQIIRFKQIDECQKICAAYSIYVKEYALNQMLEGITIPQELL